MLRSKIVNMKYIHLLLLFIISMVFSGCSAIELVFKAGMWWAFFLVFIVIFIIGWFIYRMKK